MLINDLDELRSPSAGQEVIGMNNVSKKEQEIEEIWRRLEYIKNTDQISISEKIAIARKALEVIEKSAAE